MQMSDQGKTPLWAASRFGKAGVVELLLRSNADVTRAHADGRTPLQAAAKAEPTALHPTPCTLHPTP